MDVLYSYNGAYYESCAEIVHDVFISLQYTYEVLEIQSCGFLYKILKHICKGCKPRLIICYLSVLKFQ